MHRTEKSRDRPFGINWKTAKKEDVESLPPTKRDQYNKTPLHYAAEASNLPAMEVLLKNGAKLYGRTDEESSEPGYLLGYDTALTAAAQLLAGSNKAPASALGRATSRIPHDLQADERHATETSIKAVGSADISDADPHSSLHMTESEQGKKRNKGEPIKPPYPDLLVCRAILHEAREKIICDVSPMKLIKLAYISHGFHLAYLNKPLLSDNVVAWRYGPMVESIYHAVEDNGSKPIPFEYFDEISGEMEEDTKKIIEAVLDSYGRLPALGLSHLTHNEDSLWHKVTTKWQRLFSPLQKSKIIDNDLIRNHYLEKLA